MKRKRINSTLLVGFFVFILGILYYIMDWTIERRVYLNPTDRSGGEDRGTIDLKILLLIIGTIIVIQGFRISNKSRSNES